jgi:hypothetical protein
VRGPGAGTALQTGLAGGVEMKKTLYMGTTKIDPAKTAGEITSELVKAGATSINTDFKNAKICGLRWIMRVGTNEIVFEMPVRIEPVFKAMGGRDREQAERVAWRQLLRWVQAQNAMIETGMVQAAEVYLPYMVVHAGTGQTLFQRMTETQFKALPATERPQ